MATTAPATVQATPNVTPMIDVMLVLLVIFMVAAPAMLAGIPAIPPSAEHAANRPEREADQVLGIDSLGRFYLNRRPISKDLLAGALRAIYRAPSADKVLYVRADRSVEYRAVVEALDLASMNGVAVVGMISEQQAKAEPKP